ncbi:MAG: hypothetical protein ACK4NA_02115 [Alphaproteobacteria bacterium]
MNFLGEMELHGFIRSHPRTGEMLRAWAAEMRCRTWESTHALLRDFKYADVRSPPIVVFSFPNPAIDVETLMDFRRGIVLLTEIRVADLTVSLVAEE